MFNNLAELMYVDHNSHIEDYIEELAAEPEPHLPKTQRIVASRVGLDYSMLDSYDKSYIEERLSNRHGIEI